MTTGANLSFNRVVINTRSQKRHYEQSIGALSGYLSEYIVPFLHSFEIFTGPVDSSINVPEKIDSFISDILDGLSDDFVNLSNNINNGLLNLNASSPSDQSGDVNVTSDNIKQMSELCGENAKLSYQVKDNLIDLSNASKLSITFNASGLMDFVNASTTAGNKFHAFGESVTSWLMFLSKLGSGQMNNSLRTIQSKIDRLIKDLLYSQYPNGHGIWIESLASDIEFPLRHQNFCTAFGISGSNPIELENQYNYFKQSVGEVETALREIVIFFIKWVFFSYSCSYLKDIEMDVEIQKRDALEFPNYCLVLPYKLFRDLYVTQVSRNFATYLKSNDDEELDDLSGQKSTLNPNDIGSLFRVVCDKLNIPNLIIIDEQTKKCHYKFMYMLKPTTVNFTTMENFIKHQNDVLPGF